MRPVALLLLVACGGSDNSIEDRVPALALNVALAPGETRAGVVSTSDALFAGISAEGSIGDLKIYNSRVRFIVQNVREGSYYLHQAGSVIDADIVRPAAQPGRDMVDEWPAMAGIGRLLQPTRVWVQSDGSDGDAVIVAEGWESPLDLFNGVLEGDIIENLNLKIRTEYRLPADSWFLQVTTTVTATDGDAIFQPGDAIMGAQESVSTWSPGVGFKAINSDLTGWRGYIGKRNELAFGLFREPDQVSSPGGLKAFSSLIAIIGAFGETITLLDGDEFGWTRNYGVGPDPATLTDAWLARSSAPTDTVAGVVTADDGPVAGARVTISIDDAPWTLAFTDEFGAFSAEVPAGSNTSVLAHARGTGLFFDGPAGAGQYSLYSDVAPTKRVLASLENGAPGIPMASGRGVAQAADPLHLGVPGAISITVDDGLPFAARLQATVPELPVDEAQVGTREINYPAAGWSRDGTLQLLAEPGTYELIVHRGARYTAHSEPVVIEEGQQLEVSAILARGFEHPGYLFGDPHSHSGPSPDSYIPMAERLLETAADGVQLHFATDHDHISDFRPLISPLGLQGILNTVVATEVSPVARGHLNCYPLQQRSLTQNNGAFAWWRERVQTTSEEFDLLRDRYGGPLEQDGGFILSMNHPIWVGVADLANWEPGIIGEQDYWADDFDAMEVNNGGSYETYLPLYLDLIARGHYITPVGVTDSHSYFGGGPGLNGTYIGMGIDDPAEYTDDLLRRAYLERNTIVSRGLFLQMSIAPGSVLVGDQTLDVEALGSWANADRLLVYTNDQLTQILPGPAHSIVLSPNSDASYVIVAEGDTAMSPVYTSTPWAMSSAIFIDADGDGWRPPKPPLELRDPE